MKACLSCAPRDFVSPHRVYNHITITRIANPRPRPARGNSSHHPLRARERTSHGLSPKTEYEVRSCRAYGGHVRQVAKLAATAAEISALWRLVNQQGLAVQCLCSTLFHRTRRLGSLSLLSAARLFRNPLLINSGHTLARCRPFLPLPLRSQCGTSYQASTMRGFATSDTARKRQGSERASGGLKVSAHTCSPWPAPVAEIGGEEYSSSRW